jgi:ABC-2 type transport system permease protein
LMDVFFWPILNLLVWGFLSVYLEKVNLGTVNIVSVLLGAVIFWEFLSRSQGAVSIAFLEDVWERNILNVFVTPVRISEFLASTMLLALIRIFMVGVTICLIALGLYHFNVFQFGLYTIPFLANLLLFGWTLGILTTAIILRFGTSAQVLAFGLIFVIQPFSAVFYPVSALPGYLQHISYIIPSTYVFEGMRTVISTGTLPLQDIFLSFGINLIYLALVVAFFYHMFAKVKVQGKLLKLD